MNLLPFDQIVLLKDQDFIDRNELVWKSILALDIPSLFKLTEVFKDFDSVIIGDLWQMYYEKAGKTIALKIAALEFAPEEREAVKNLFGNSSLGDLGELLLDDLYEVSRKW